MKTPYQIAKELNVSPQAIYKRLTDEFNNQFNNHIQRTQKGRYLLDAVAEQGLKDLFNQVQQPDELYCVYKHLVPNGKVYIGITSLKPYIRWSNGNGYKAHTEFYSDINEYGWESVKHMILADGLTKSQAEIEENRLIIEYESYKPERGYNKQFKLLKEIESVVQPLLNQLNTENVFLRQRIDVLEQELKIEREHSREQTDKLINLAAKLAVLTENSQVLLGAEQSRTNPILLSSTDPIEPISSTKRFFIRLFKRKN